MRFADYFGRAFASVSSAQFPWLKTFRESSVSKLVDVSFYLNFRCCLFFCLLAFSCFEYFVVKKRISLGFSSISIFGIFFFQNEEK